MKTQREINITTLVQRIEALENRVHELEVANNRRPIVEEILGREGPSLMERIFGRAR